MHRLIFVAILIAALGFGWYLIRSAAKNKQKKLEEENEALKKELAKRDAVPPAPMATPDPAPVPHPPDINELNANISNTNQQ